MSPADVLKEYFLSQIYERYRRPTSIPVFDKAVQPHNLIRDVVDQPGLPHSFASIVQRHCDQLKQYGGEMLCLGDPRYPELLRHVPDPPWAINVLGHSHWLNHAATASIIGSRKAPPFSLRSAFDLGRELSNQNTVVVSGGAFGCDIAAHHGCLASGHAPLGAVVVLAGGVDHRYPKANAEVFEDLLAQGGAVVSERLCGYHPKNYDFPTRNRIIAGLCQVLYVVSAGRRSGAMITARKALDYGRDVYVLQPHQQDARHDGINDLLFDGALGFESVAGLIENGPSYL